ncbi:MAG: hypothetical protein HY596_04125 [Candidatus Omnitrophica bacterium]|nr:hypothetical protein [Candidatus Omnitrophota bacterium]
MVSGIGLLLLSAVAGYWVLERSATHPKKNLKRVGQAVGWFVILVSILGVACKVYGLASGKGAYCPSGSRCPFSSKMPAASPVSK